MPERPAEPGIKHSLSGFVIDGFGHGLMAGQQRKQFFILPAVVVNKRPLVQQIDHQVGCTIRIIKSIVKNFVGILVVRMGFLQRISCQTFFAGFYQVIESLAV